MRRTVLVVVALLLIATAGCTDRAPLATSAPYRPGYPLPSGTTIDLTPEHPPVTVTTGDLVTVPRWVGQYEHDTELFVLAEVTDDHLIYQALRYGTDWMVVGPAPRIRCNGNLECAVPPLTVVVTVE